MTKTANQPPTRWIEISDERRGVTYFGWEPAADEPKPQQEVFVEINGIKLIQRVEQITQTHTVLSNFGLAESFSIHQNSKLKYVAVIRNALYGLRAADAQTSTKAHPQAK